MDDLSDEKNKNKKKAREGFDRGRRDYRLGKRRHENFYPAGSPRHLPWFEGWDEEYRLDQEEPGELLRS